MLQSYNPLTTVVIRVWANPLSLATTYGITELFSLPPGTEMFQFSGFAFPLLGISRLHRDGLPHSETCGSLPICGSPQLIAAYHVLHRLWEPRHPPYTLNCFHFLSNLALELSMLIEFWLIVLPFPICQRTLSRSRQTNELICLWLHWTELMQPLKAILLVFSGENQLMKRN